MTRIPLSALDGQSFDIAVIGAGAVGCSVAQHLVARGYKVTLLDQGDIASDTSCQPAALLRAGVFFTRLCAVAVSAAPARSVPNRRCVWRVRPCGAGPSLPSPCQSGWSVIRSFRFAQ